MTVKPIILEAMQRKGTRKTAPHQRILDLIRALSPVDAQNRLLRIRDTDLALSMLYMVASQREQVVLLAGPAKGGRVQEALARLEHTRIRYDQYEATADAVIQALSGGKPTDELTGRSGGSAGTGGTRSYYRPTRAR